MRIFPCNFVFIFALLSLFLLTPLFADESHYKEVLVGDRAASMGGAYAAIADDAAGAYYNPAGMVYNSGEGMTGISNVYHYLRKDHNAYQWPEDEEGLNKAEKTGSQYFVSSFGYMKKFNGTVIGLSFVINDSMDMRQQQEFNDIYPTNDKVVINSSEYGRVYQYGPTFAYQVDKDLSFGATLYFYQKEYDTQINTLYTYESGGTWWRYTSKVGSELGWNLITGMTWTPVEPLSVAVVLSKTTLHHSEEFFQISRKDTTSDAVSYESEIDHTKRKFPIRLTLAFAYFYSPYLLFSADFDYHHLVEENKRSILNFSFGTEYFITEKYVVRAGFFTNKDNDIGPSKDTLDTEQINMYGVTAGASVFAGPTMITLGGVYSEGTGFSQEIEFSSQKHHTTRSQYSFLLGVSYSIE